MELKQWFNRVFNRVTLSISVPLAIYMVGQPGYESVKNHLVKPEIQALQDEIKKQEPSVKLASPTAILHKEEENLLAKAKDFSSIKDFFNLAMDKESRELLTQMMEDRFQSQNPYHNLSSVYPVALMLSKGVTSWNRHVYRSSEFNQEYGYDVVKYVITHDDTSTSYLFAYREKNQEQRLWLGEEDKRPTLATFLVNRGDGLVFRMNFVNGDIEQSDNIDLSVALNSMQDKMNKATPIASRDAFY